MGINSKNIYCQSKKETKDLKLKDGIWSSDLTYMKYKGRFFYLAIIKDIATREVVSFNLGDRNNSGLVLRTIQEGVKVRGQFPEIFHFDRGKEFLNKDCVYYLKENMVLILASDAGSP